MKRVLDVGNCDPDHSSIKRLLEQQFDVELVRAHGRDDALKQWSSSEFDLVLVNRLMDRDGSSGLAIIEELCGDEARTAPVMMITNFADHQERAVAAGAVPGFGKAALNESATIDKLAKHLAS